MTDRMSSAAFRARLGLPAPGVDAHPVGVGKFYENQTRARLPSAEPIESAPTLDSQNEGKTCSTGRPHVRFVCCRVRLLDVDAKFSAIKDLLDGLAIAGLIRGDKEEEITLEVEQVRVRHYAEERTEIEIVYPD